MQYGSSETLSLVIETFEDLVHIIETHPEWRRRLKRSLFDVDIEAALTRLEQAIEQLVTIQRQQAADIAVLKTDVAVLKTDVAVLKTDVAVLKTDVSSLKTDMKGKSYEHDYRLKANAIFGRFIRRGRDRTDDVADQLHDAVAAGTLSAQELAQVLSADLVWGGKSRENERDVIVVLEASWRAETADVERARQRAATLQRIGLHAIPVVAGMEWGEQALTLADSLAVAVAANGQIDAGSWQKALMASLALPG
jgi:hypothetical protein